MLEHIMPDVHETKSPDQSEFSRIKPETGISLEKTQHFWENLPTKPENIHSDINDEGDTDEGSANIEAETNEKKPIYITTRNESLENDVHPITGVPFERRVIDLPNGESIEGVFPNFDSLFDAKIPKELYLSNDEKQFKECNKQLYERIENNQELRNMFSEEQIEQIKDGIKDGTAPDGYVWHHDAAVGKLQLVNAGIHAITGHTGGRAIWGGGEQFR